MASNAALRVENVPVGVPAVAVRVTSPTNGALTAPLGTGAEARLPGCACWLAGTITKKLAAVIQATTSTANIAMLRRVFIFMLTPASKNAINARKLF